MSEAKKEAFKATVETVNAYMGDCKINVTHDRGPENLKTLIQTIYDKYAEIAQDAMGD